MNMFLSKCIFLRYNYRYAVVEWIHIGVTRAQDTWDHRKGLTGRADLAHQIEIRLLKQTLFDSASFFLTCTLKKLPLYR